MKHISDEMVERARDRAHLLVTIALDEDPALAALAIDEYRALLPSVDPDSTEFAEFAGLITTLVSMLCGQIDLEANQRGLDPIEVFQEWAAACREEDDDAPEG